MKTSYLLFNLCVLTLLLTTIKLKAQSNCNNGFTGNVPQNNEYVLVWSDEFDTDGAVCTENWHHQTQLIAGNSWANGELQHYTNRIDNSLIENGNLKIVAKRESFTDQGVAKNFTSARLNSKFAFTYGRVDVRAKLPAELGTWPAIWMLGKNISEAGAFWDADFGTTPWPATGEIDIMEQFGRASNEKNDIHGTTHTTAGSGGNANGGMTSAPTSTTEFHVYSILWDENEIQFLLDGQEYYTYNPVSIYGTKNTSNWPFDEPQFLLLNVAMGGVLGGNVPSTFQEATMEIDYVRVYQNYDEDPSDNIDPLDPQTITFNNLSDKTLGDDPFTLSASSSSTLDVTFSSASSNITLSGNEVSLLAAGQVTIDADQAGNTTFAAAPTVSQTFCINPMTPAITSDGGNTIGVTLTSDNNEGNQWFLDGTFISGATAPTFVANSTGLYSVQVTINGCTSAMSADFEVIEPAELITQTITFDAITDKMIGDDPFTLNATASSGLEVTYSSFSIELDVEGSRVTLLKPGTVVITAEQLGNEEYLPAEPVTQIFCVNPARPLITISDNADEIMLESSSELGNQWYLNGNLLSDERGQNITVAKNGIYTSQVTIDGCRSPFSAETPIIITSLSLNNKDFEIMPNPVIDFLKVYGSSVDDVIQIVDLKGKKYLSEYTIQEDHLVINVQNLPSGVFVVIVKNEKGNYQYRFIKE